MVKVRVWCVRLTFFFCLFHLTAASAAPGILSPPDGSVLSGSSETFTWSADGTVIDRWRLEVGTAPDTVNLFASSFASSITSVQVNGLPTDGSSVHVNLKWRVNGVVSVASYVYTAFDDSVPPANVAPTVSAGVDQAIALPIDTVTLSGVATDDGLPLGALNLTWSMLSGPAAVSFLDPTQASTSATFVTPGDYVLQLNASDTLLNTSDQMSVTVHASAVLTTIQVTPGSTVLLANETQQFVATGLDQTGEPYAITPDWAATGGSIDTAGLYAAGVVTGQFEVAPSAASVFGQADIFIVDNLGPWPTNGWQSAIPSDAEMEQSLLEQARDYALTGGGAGMITRHGQLVMSWGDTSRLYDVNSVTKSIGALLLGLAVKDSIVTLSDLAQTHYPAVGANPTTNVSTGWLNEITVMNLATHSAGFAKPAGYVDMLVQPGTAWAYSDAGFNWLADTLTVANQSDLLPILDSRILSPLGVTTADYSWSNSVHRDTLVEGFVRREFNSSIDISVDAMARVGYLALRNGSWDSQNIIQPAFIDQMQATVPGVTGLPVSNDLDSKYGGAPEHYGIGWWNNADGALPNVPTDAYWAWGVGDFLILVIPSLDIVASRAGTPWAGSRTPSYYPVLGPFFDPIAQSVTTFGNEAPTVDAGFDDSITLPTTTLNLVGIVSDDGLPDGTLDITWSQIAGPATVVFGNETLAATAATFTDSGDYTLRLTATDGLASASDDVLITVLPEPDSELPVVAITQPISNDTVSGLVTVTATATDNDSVVDVEFFAAGVSIGVDATSPYSVIWNSTVATDGDHDIAAFGRDPAGNESGDSIMVTVDNAAAANQPPVVGAGVGGVITLPTDTIGLGGTAIDDGLPSGSLTTTWSAINPPFAVTFADASALTTTATFAGSGSYLLRLTADDGALTASADVTVTVNPDLTTDPQTFVAIADNTINGAQPTRVIGGGTVVQAHGFGPKVGLVQFDLSSLTGSSVSAASFRFRLSSLASNGDISIQLVDEAWSEDSVNYDNQPSFGATVLTVPVTMADVGTVLSVDVTGIVQSWVDGSQPSHGFRLATSQSINASMDSRESSGIPMDLLVTVDNGVSTVSAPSISPNGGSSATPVQVTLATVTPGASIYYTLDGSIPTSGSNSYTAPFTLDASATVKARATAPGLSDSVVVSADFVINSALTGDLNNYWSLNEIVGASYANNVGSTAGTCINCPTPTSGLVNGAQSFDGTNDVISVADDGSADWVLTAGFTVEFWVNKNNACTAREVVVGRHDGGTAMQWAVGCDSGTAFFELTDANGTSATAMGSSAIDDGAWHHIVAVYDAFYDEIRLYKDGGLDASASVTYATGFASAADITIGELQNGLSDTFFNGIVDEVALHDRAIPVSLIARHHLDGSIGLHGGYTGCSAPVKFMPLGDSNTNRLGYRPTLYFDLIDRGLDVDFVGSHSDNPTAGTHDRDHEGWSGFTTTDIAANLDGWLSGNPPDVVFLHIGTNDIDIVTAAEAIIGLAGILDIIHAFDPDITVVLGQIINRQTFSQETADYNEQMVALAQTKLAAGYRILLVDHENALAYPDDMVDLEHANDSGYAKMAGVWLDGATDFLPACNAAAPIFRSIASSSGQVAIEYRYQPTVLGNPVARFTALTSPAGMRVHPDTGEVRWVPSAAGQYNVDLQIQNSAGSQVQGFILTIP